MVTGFGSYGSREGQLMNVQYPIAGLRGARVVPLVGSGREAGGPPSGPASVPACRVRDFQMAAMVPARADAVAGARRQLASLLQRSGLSECADAVELVAQELMVNAMVHGCGNRPDGRISVRATHGRGRVRVEVEDPSIQQPHPRSATADEEGGRGLHLVDALVTRWGTDCSAPGKTVWFELDVPEGATS
ncbi:ATP-binding protein [Streptomyces rubiginosohelvolus]|uniref:ATP-binding protein n=1 Tax=Streptomyces rubiginosohelvolus TaxID=67362 RepID=UPI0036C96D90